MSESVAAKLKVVLLYKRDSKPDAHMLGTLERELKADGHDIFIDRHLHVGVKWAREIEQKIRSADAVVVILSDAALGSEMLLYEVETAVDERLKRGRPMILPIRVGSDSPIGGEVGGLLDEFHFAPWKSEADDSRVLEEVRRALERAPSIPKERLLDPVGGALPPDSPLYIRRSCDDALEDAIRANESVILIRGPRQIGKTSLLGQGASLVADLGWRSASTDFQMVGSTYLQDADKFARMVAATLAKQLGSEYDFDSEWLEAFGPNLNLGNFVRAVLEESEKPLVWFMDEADRVFTAAFASDYFGLVRSWHNARATDPKGPWSRFTLVIAYATEARLFIRDLNQSPFNVGRQIPMENFSLEQIQELNRRYGSPIRRDAELDALQFTVSGQPFLVHRALQQLAKGEVDFRTLLEGADRDDGPFGDHLKRLLIAVSQDSNVFASVTRALDGLPTANADAEANLVAAGVLRETSGGQVEPACDLYARYLERHLS